MTIPTPLAATTRRTRRGPAWAMLPCAIAVGSIVITAPTLADIDQPAAAERPAIPARGTGSIDNIGAAPDARPSPVLEQPLASAIRSSTAATIRVEVVGEPDAVDDAVQAVGGTIERGGGGLYGAVVPTRRVAELATAVGVSSVRSPGASKPQAPYSSPRGRLGRVGTQAGLDLNSWHMRGYRGAGAKVGIIGLFDPIALTNEIASGELPRIPDSNRVCVTGPVLCPFGTNGATFGVDVAQILVDSAPDASLYLAELGSLLDYYPVIDWFAANGVRILVNPFVFAYDGPGDGTGPAAAVVDYAASKGIAWFNTAGEFAANPQYTRYAGGYWRGVWSDPDNDRWLNFSGTDEAMSFQCSFFLGLRWSDFGAATKTDYDLYVSEYNASTGATGTPRVASAVDQSLPGALPLEANGTVNLCNTNPTRGTVFDTNGDGFVSLRVQRKTTSAAATATGDILELASYYGYFEYATSNGSVGFPFADSKNRAAATVGGVLDRPVPYGLPSWGLTNDGRFKPDFATYACTTTASQPAQSQCAGYGTYYGTDGSAASAAGYAAVAMQALDIRQAWQVVRFVRDNSYQTTSAPPYAQGYGQITFRGTPTDVSVPAPFLPSPAPYRLLDTRTGFGTYKVGPLLPDETRTIAGTLHTVAMVLNVAVVQPTGNGFVSVFPHGVSYPGATATMNVQAGVTRSNLVIVPSGYGNIDVYTQGGGHVVIDVVGTMTTFHPMHIGTGRYRAVSPARVLDSQTCVGLDPCTGQRLAAGTFNTIDFGTLDLPGLPAGTVPANATAVALSVTVRDPEANGYLSAIPGDSTSTSTSTLNYVAGLPATSLAMVRIDGSAAASARLFLSRAAHLQVDLLGWFTGPSNLTSDVGMYRAIQPSRLFDSRSGGAPPLAASSEAVVSTLGAWPRGEVMAAFVNVASAQSTAPGEVQVGLVPSAGGYRGLSFPAAGQAISAATIATTDDEAFRLRPSAPTHLIVDSTGFFVGIPVPPEPGSLVRVSRYWDGGTAGATYRDRARQVVANGDIVLFETLSSGVVQSPVPNAKFYIWRRATNTSQQIPLPVDGSIFIDESGTKIVFDTLSSLVPEDTDAVIDTYLANVDGSNVRLATSPLPSPTVVSAASPDLSRLVVSIYLDVFVVVPDTGATTLIQRPVGYQLLISPDASKVVLSYTDFVTADTTLIIRSLVDGTDQTFVLPDQRFLPAVWSTDGGTMYGSRFRPLNAYDTELETVLFDIATGAFRTKNVPDVVAAIAPGGQSVIHFEGNWKRRDLNTGRDTTIPATWNGVPLNGASQPSMTMSRDGRFVAFVTLATNLLDETVPSNHIYLRDLQPN